MRRMDDQRRPEDGQSASSLDDTKSLTQKYLQYDGIGKAFLSVQEVDRRRDEVWSDRLNDIGQIISRCD